MEDMLHYLNHDFGAPPEGKLRIVAVRHEDGSWGESSFEYQGQRKRLFHNLAEVVTVEVDGDADAKDPHETGNIWIDVATLGVTAVVPLLAAWISKQPRKDEPTLPGFVLQVGASRLQIDHRVPEAERKRLIEAFLRDAKA